MIKEIPRRIIQTGKTRELSILAKGSAANLKALNPGFEYRYFDDADITAFISEEFPEYRPVFDAFRFPIQKIDFFRYLAIYRYGGFYFDLDVILARGLESLLHTGCVFPFEEITLSRFLRSRYGIDWEIGNYAFGAAPGHPLLQAVIENCIKAQRDADWVAPMLAGIPRLFRSDFYVLSTTGPGLLTRTLAENPQAAGTMTILFPDDVCDPKTWHHFGQFGIHLMEGSWRDRGGMIRRRLASLWERWSCSQLFARSRKVGKARRPPGFH